MRDATTLHAAIARKLLEGIKDALTGDDDLWEAIDLCVRDQMRHEGTHALLCPNMADRDHVALVHIAGDQDGHEVALTIEPIVTDVDEVCARYDIAAYRRLAAELLAHAEAAEAALRDDGGQVR